MDRDIIRNFLDESYDQFAAGQDDLNSKFTQIEINLDSIELGDQDPEVFEEIRELLKVIEAEVVDLYKRLRKAEEGVLYRSGDQDFS